MVLKPDLTVQTVNEAFYKDFKVNKKETIGHKIYDLGNSQWDIPELRKLLEEVLPSNNYFKNYEVQHEFESIGKKTMVLNGHRLDDVQLILLTIRDISRSKEYQNELYQAKTVAEKAALVKEEFLAHMSHEIRTPLNSIVGLSHLLSKLPHDKQQERNLQYLKTASENLNKLLNDILDYSKLKSGKWCGEPKEFKLREFIEDLTSVHRLTATEKNIDLETDVDVNIPEMIEADESKLMHVLNNLLSNAIKFTPEGHVNLTVKLKDRKGKKLLLQFSVSDTGIGIKKNMLNDIFDEFSQADRSDKKEYKGTGLGLTITKLYLQSMKSDINVESTYGKGSRFWFEINVKEMKKATKSRNASATGTIEKKIGDMRILIVEDDDFSRMMMSQLFSLWGVDHKEAVNGMEAIELSQKNNFDIIFIDIHMPEMNGIEATEKIRKIDGYKHKPIFAITADLTDGILNQENSGLFTDKIHKPYNPDEILSRINNVLHKAKS